MTPKMKNIIVQTVVVMMELSVCMAVTNVHNVGSVTGGDSAWQNSMPVATPVQNKNKNK